MILERSATFIPVVTISFQCSAVLLICAHDPAKTFVIVA